MQEASRACTLEGALPVCNTALEYSQHTRTLTAVAPAPAAAAVTHIRPWQHMHTDQDRPSTTEAAAGALNDKTGLVHQAADTTPGPGHTRTHSGALQQGCERQPGCTTQPQTPANKHHVNPPGCVLALPSPAPTGPMGPVGAGDGHHALQLNRQPLCGCQVLGAPSCVPLLASTHLW
jgi:hypothetical protein